MAHWEIQGWMILILGWVFVPFYSRRMVYTMPEYLERRYNHQSHTILSVISLVGYVLTKVAVTVYAGGLVFQQVFGIKELWGIEMCIRDSYNSDADKGVDYTSAMGGTYTGYYLKKFVNNISCKEPATYPHAWMIFRYGEILLNAAEAYNLSLIHI